MRERQKITRRVTGKIVTKRWPGDSYSIAILPSYHGLLTIIKADNTQFTICDLLRHSGVQNILNLQYDNATFNIQNYLRAAECVCVIRKTQSSVAFKVYHKTKMTKEKECLTYSELALMKRMKHQNIIHLLDELDTPSALFMVVELPKVDDIVVPYFIYCLTLERPCRIILN